MSISTPSGEQKSPGSVKISGKPGAKPGSKTGAKPGAKPTTSAGKGKPTGGGPRRPITPIKVNQGRNWGPIALFTAVGLLAAGIIGWAAWAAFRPGGAGYSWETRAKSIVGIQDLRGPNLTAGHDWAPQTYDRTPPVGGTHNFVWQQCSGSVYESPIPTEHAVHSMEHGAVWIAYRSDLPADQVAILQSKILGKDFTLISPIDNLDTPVSVQAWGWQLKVSDVNDPRIADFIGALAKNAQIEPISSCGGGNTATGTTPLTEQQAIAKGLAGGS